MCAHQFTRQAVVCSSRLKARRNVSMSVGDEERDDDRLDRHLGAERHGTEHGAADQKKQNAAEHGRRKRHEEDAIEEEPARAGQIDDTEAVGEIRPPCSRQTRRIPRRRMRARRRRRGARESCAIEARRRATKCRRRDETWSNGRAPAPRRSDGRASRPAPRMRRRNATKQKPEDQRLHGITTINAELAENAEKRCVCSLRALR